MADFLGLVWAGMISGCLYAMGAIGIVLIFKSSMVVNFAHGNLAGLAAFLVFGFTGGTLAQLAWGPAVLLTLVIMVGVMLLAYLLIAPLVFKSDLTSTIASLGVGLIAQGATQLTFGSNVVSPGLLARLVSASITATVRPVGKRPISLPAPRIVVGCNGTVSPYVPASVGVRPMRRL